MIIPDINLLIHTYNAGSARHAAAVVWWEGLLNRGAVVGLPWVTVLGFIRISTHRSILAHPLTVETACWHVQSWFAQPGVQVVEAGHQHLETLTHLLRHLGTAGNLTTDAHLAALAIEHNAELHTTDADFARFPGLRWRQPI